MPISINNEGIGKVFVGKDEISKVFVKTLDGADEIFSGDFILYDNGKGAENLDTSAGLASSATKNPTNITLKASSAGYCASVYSVDPIDLSKYNTVKLTYSYDLGEYPELCVGFGENAPIGNNLNVTTFIRTIIKRLTGGVKELSTETFDISNLRDSAFFRLNVKGNTTEGLVIITRIELL